jgi:hypothetical protein
MSDPLTSDQPFDRIHPLGLVYQPGASSFSLFERSLSRRQLFGHESFKEKLASLWIKFVEHHGTTFVKAMDALPQAP